jgi:hypothetical protein
LLAEQTSGIGAYYLLVDDDGWVMGRFNLVFAGDGVAVLGYRVAEPLRAAESRLRRSEMCVRSRRSITVYMPSGQQRRS